MVQLFISRPVALLTLAAACLVTMGGCSMAPTYTRPDVSLPTVLGENVVGATVPQRGALTERERAYLTSVGAGPGLVDLVSQALASNADFSTAVTNVSLARAAMVEQRAAMAPQLNASVQAEKYGFSDSEVDALSSSSYAFGGLALTQELDFFGRALSLNSAARQRLIAGEQAQAAARTALIREVLRTHIALAAAKEVVGANQVIQEDAEASLRAIKLLQELGSASKADVLQADFQYQEALAATRSAEANARNVERALALVAGFGAAPVQSSTAAMAEAARETRVPANIPSSVLLRNPEVLAAEAKLRARNADIGAARAAFFPSISLTGAYGKASDDLSDLFRNGATGWAFLPQIDIPIFDFGARKANLDASWVRMQTGVKEYEASIQRAFKAASDAMDALTVAQARSDLSLQRVADIQARLASAGRRADAGLDDRSHVRQLRTAAAREELSRIQADADSSQARADLYAALDGTDVLK